MILNKKIVNLVQMGFSVQIYLFGNDKIRKIPLSKFQRFFDGDKGVTFPEYSDKKVKIALVMLNYTNRQPEEVLKIDYNIMWIKHDGTLDQEKRHDEALAAIINSTFAESDNDLPPNVIDASSFFAKKQYETKYKWQPTQKEIDRLYKSIFKFQKS